MKKSAGILVYKKENNKIYILLCHFGGPYRASIDKGAWSLPKGEFSNNETAIEAAKREFTEETNLQITTEIKYLSSKKISKNKLAIMFYTNSDYNLDKCKSNTFELEFPKKSGIIKKFPEMDKYEWMEINKAKDYIIPNQLYFITKLEEKVNK